MAGLQTFDGNAVSWNELSLLCAIDGGSILPIIDIKSIDTESSVDRGDQRGLSGGRIRKRTTGQLSNSASMSLYTEGLDALERSLVTAALASGFVNADGNVQLSRVLFNIISIYSFAGSPTIYHKELLGCHLNKDSAKAAEGPDPNLIDIELAPLQIVKVINGVRTVLL